MSVGQLQMQLGSRSRTVVQFLQLVVEDHVAPPTGPSGCGRCRGSARAAFMDRSIAMTGVIPLPAVTNSILAGGGSGSAKSPLGAARRTIVPGFTPFTRWVDRKPSGVALTVMEMSFLSRPRDRRQRVGPPVPAAVDAQADADVLTGLVVAGEAPARLDGHGGGVFGLPSARQRPRRGVRAPTTAG